MAERRMFAKTIIDSDIFLDLPLSTQALYFHLSMRADDEGFINNPRKIMRMVGAATNELDILIAKRFLLTFDSGVVVIKHWKIHNYIQKDRLKATLYKGEKANLIENEDKIYSDNIKTLDTVCVQDVDTGKVREELVKSKPSKVKVNVPEGTSEQLTLKLEEFIKHRKTVKKPWLSNRPLEALIKKIGSEYVNEEHLILCLDHTMDNQYIGVKGEYVKYKSSKHQEDIEVIF